MTITHRIAFATLAAPLALALTACSGGDGDDAAAGEPVTAVPAPEGSSWSEQAVRTEAGGWRIGNPEAPISLIEYGSLTCPACAMFSRDGSEELHSEYIESGRINFEFRSLAVHGIIDVLLTRVLECGSESAVVPLADQLWANVDTVTGGFQANGAAIERAFALPDDQRFAAMASAGGLLDFFAARGISRDQAQVCLSDSEAVQTLADAMQAAADEDNVNSTPTFFLNGRRVDGTSWNAVEAALQRAGARPAED